MAGADKGKTEAAPLCGLSRIRSKPEIWREHVGAGVLDSPWAEVKNYCHPEERSDEGSRMVTLIVLFTGFFTAARFRMTDV